ncbi:hypothetical protein E4U26_003447 [Claviceps purpurea]|nr:hypothetical protein E4U26_003447 [Claviceps purpurea]
MNRFRTKKKARDDASIGGRPSIDAEPSGPFRMFGKKKTQDDEPKPEVDLAAALPSSDDFRTSLLMTGLSARFSMLREQDDPNSKLGKASDDSVLHPNRQSKMGGYGGLGSGLDDIAEIESLRAPQMGRYDAYQSDDASSTTGSVMSRAKPNEGNNLFGGRQKIYKLTAGSRAGMSGRALYEDDVAQSSFQRWRQAEKEKNAAAVEHHNGAFEAETPLDYNMRRETSSTTSSAPSIARNSTAATSITSQPSSIKDTHSGMSLPGLERNVTRTRRLYEQGLTQDLHDHQSSSLSRMDTLSKQGSFGTKSPDPTSAVPSPTASTFGDRVTDRRTVISKASAPNLRSFSPHTLNSSQTSPAESAMSKFTRSDQKSSFGSTPPLSPPISETEEPSALATQVGDRGKATAMGVLNRPSMQYDETRYAQRQRQLQQGRETPTLRNASGPATSSTPSMRQRSRSSSAQRTTIERTGPPKAPLPTIPVNIAAQMEVPGSTVFDDSDHPLVTKSKRPDLSVIPPQLMIKRPDDHDHPAFRKSALPTPLILSSPKSPDSQGFPTAAAAQSAPPEDSPTLGPNGGLSVSGMVRHHLRNCSGASSMYGAASHETEPDEKERLGDLSRKSSVEMKTDDGGEGDDGGDDGDVDRDEFAQHLADGARRVRERLNTYVESDNDHSAPPTPPQSEQNKDFNPPKSSGFPTLIPKSSRGALFDRSEKDRGRAMGLKSTGSHHGYTDGRGPSPRNTSSSRGPSRNRAETIDQGEIGTAKAGENMHVGLKAFRQARRELQRMKEAEVQNRHEQRSSPSQERAAYSRTPSYENGPPPALFNRMPRGDDQLAYGGRSRAASRAASERDRSGSEASNGACNFSRGPRLRNGSVTYDEHFVKAGASGVAGPDVQRPILESPSRSHTPYMANGPPPAAMAMSPGSHGPHAHGPHGPHAPHAHHAYHAGPHGLHGPPGVGGRGEPGGRYFAPRMQSPTPHDAHHYGRSRNGSLIGTASSPNLHAIASMASPPPLPPINPRRKNGMPRSGEEGFGATSPSNPFGLSDGYTGDDDTAGDQYRRARSAHGQMRYNSSAAVRPPIPHSNISSASMPGGMI